MSRREIRLFMHCAKCVREGSGGQRLEVGITDVGLQVWCKRHDIAVADFDFEGIWPPVLLRARGGACGHCGKTGAHEH